jgi:hypothetical protein
MTDMVNILIMVVTIIGVCILNPFPGLIKMQLRTKDEEFHVSTVLLITKHPIL